MKPASYSNSTKILGILGNPLSHTLSPTIHNTFYEEMGLDAVYLVFDKKHPTKHELNTLTQYGLKGLSVTIPYKEWAYEIADVRDPYSEIMKAANTLVFQEGKILSYNTDGLGAVAAIQKEQLNLFNSATGKNVLICGSGGSARGISFAILDEWNKNYNNNQNKIWIVSRNETTCTHLVEDLNLHQIGSAQAITLADLNAVRNRIDLVIHTTPLGMFGKEQVSFLPYDFLTNSMTVFDIVYNPKHTILIQEAYQKGASIIYGIEMLLYQAIRQHELFTNTSPNIELIDKVRNLLESKLQNL